MWPPHTPALVLPTWKLAADAAVTPAAAMGVQHLRTCHAAAVDHLVQVQFLLGALLHALQCGRKAAEQMGAVGAACLVLAVRVIFKPPLVFHDGLKVKEALASEQPPSCLAAPPAPPQKTHSHTHMYTPSTTHLLNGAFSAQAVHVYRLGLADAVHTRHGLQVDLRVPICAHTRTGRGRASLGG